MGEGGPKELIHVYGGGAHGINTSCVWGRGTMELIHV